MKTSELTGAALDWAVAKAEGADMSWDEVAEDFFMGMHHDLCFLKEFKPSTDWVQGGPIIEREHLGVCYYHEADGWEVPNWAAWRTDIDDRVQIMGETALIAAMRCVVTKVLGAEVDVPEELL